MVKKVTNECLVALKEKIYPEFTLPTEDLEVKILEASSSALAQEEVGKFTFQVKAHSSVLAFKTQDLEDFVLQFISSQIPSGKKLYRESLKINYVPESIDLELGKGVLSLTLEAKIYSDIDETNLKRALKEKTLVETQFFLQNYPQITKASIKFWPFWVKRVPENEEKIIIKLKLD